MAYKALYRTYRPTTFDEVAGQQHIVKTLKNALATGKIAHAYLFAGPRGTGKTTMAKLLAKALNCSEGIGHQCNECKNCKAILDGNHPDVIEIDAASNNGVKEVRDLIDKVKYGTILGNYKIYIIDEVHMMTTEAFNALLKTLEEPPAHVIFILATTEPHEIIPTILSRCQRYDFSKVSDEDIKERLKIILQKEGVSYVEEAINLIVSLADGGMRDALSMLDQVLAYSSNQLKTEDILDIFALESTEEKINLLKSIGKNDVNDVLSRISNYIAKGSDIKRFTDDLLLILKDVLIYQSSYKDTYLEVLKLNQAKELSDLLNSESTLKMIDALMNTVKEYKSVSNIVPLFQVTILKLAHIGQNAKPNSIKTEPTINHETRVISKPVETIKEEIKVEEIKPVILSNKVLYLNNTNKEVSFEIDDELMIQIMVTSKKEIKNSLLNEWHKIKTLTMHPELGKAATMLIDGHPLVVGNKIIIIEYQLSKIVENFNRKENQESIQNVINNVFGRKMFAYAVSRNDSVRLQKKYMDLLQLNKLPKADSVQLDFKGE